MVHFAHVGRKEISEKNMGSLLYYGSLGVAFVLDVHGFGFHIVKLGNDAEGLIVLCH